MLRFKKELMDITKFWIYWILVVTLTIGLFFALLDSVNFEGEDLEFYLAHKDDLKYNFRLFAVISFILTYISSTPLINHLYKNEIVSSGKRFLLQTLIYFLILITVLIFFILQY